MPSTGAAASSDTNPKSTTTSTTTMNGMQEDDLEQRIRPTNLPKYPYDGEIVIAGCASRLPESANIDQFTKHLFDMKHMHTTTEKAQRYEEGFLGNQVYMGAMPDIDKFDASFFGMYPSMAQNTDPSCRMLSERAYEAIVDAGESLDSLKGTRTGVFIGALPSDSSICITALERINGYSFIGYAHSHLANRLSFFFDFKGSSYSMDSACSSGLVALETAMTHIRMGYLDYALVGTSNLVLDPQGSLTAVRVGMLCEDGKCKAFDASANGFVRADGNMILFLAKKELAKRVYCTVLHVRGNSDGFTKEGIAVPSGESQSNLLRSVYNDMGIDPNTVFYAEAHGPGTAVGDGIEVDAIADVLCSNRKQPLYLGSVKTNMGHCEGAAGLASMIKTIIACERKMIPPNLHYKNPNPNISSLFDGRVKVVDQPVPFEGGLISVSSFGVGGTNYNGAFRSYKNENRPPHPASELPRLFVYGARAKNTASDVMDEAKKHSKSVEYQALLEASSNMPANKMPYRMYTVLNAATGKYEDVKKQGFDKRPLWLSFSGMGTQWIGMGKDMMSLPPFRESIQQTAEILKNRYNYDLYDVILRDADVFDNAINAFCGITAVSMALYDCLHAMKLEPDGMFGHSLGEASAGYADGSLTREEAILLSYWRGEATRVAEVVPGKMLAVGLSWEQAKAAERENCFAACDNAASSVTMSGMAGPMSELMNDLKAKGVFVREVNSLGKSYHSKFVRPLAPIITEGMGNILVPKKRSSRWISTSVPEENWERQGTHASVEYFRNNLQNPVLYHNAVKKVPQNAIVIEVSPNPIFQSILKKSIGGNVTVLSLMKKVQESCVEYFLDQLGKAYISGLDVYPLGLYPKVQFPVPKGTPHASPLVNQMWDHSMTWYIPHSEEDRRKSMGKERAYGVDLEKTEDAFLRGHNINGQNVYPAAAYLVLAWKSLAHIKGEIFEEMPVVIKDVQFLQDYILPDTGEVLFRCRIQGNGSFEICQSVSHKISQYYEEDITLARGYIYCLGDEEDEEEGVAGRIVPTNMPDDVDLSSEPMVLSDKEVYKSIGVHGWEYSMEFKGIIQATHTFSQADIQWTGNWTTHIDNILQCLTQCRGLNSYAAVAGLGTLQIDPLQHWESSVTTETGEVVRVKCDPITNMAVGGAIVVQHLELDPKHLEPQHQPFVANKTVFVPYVEKTSVANEWLQRYASDCCDFCKAGLNKSLLEDGWSGILPNKVEIAQVIGKENGTIHLDGQISKYMQDPKCGLARMLQDIFKVPKGKGFHENIRKILTASQEDLSQDMLWTSLTRDDVLQPALEIVLDNSPPGKVTMLELDAGKSRYFTRVAENMRRNPMLSLTYKVADQVDLKEHEENFGAQYVNWNLESSANEDPKTKNNVILVRNVLSKQPDIKNALERISAKLEDKGFLLVQEVTSNFPIALATDRLESNLPAYTDKRDVGRFLIGSSWESIFNTNGFEIIYTRSDGVLSTLYLLRKSVTIQGPAVFVNLTNPSATWLDDIKRKYKEAMESPSDDARLWICTDSFVTGAVGFYRALCQESGDKASRLRCIVKGNVQPNSQGIYISAGSQEFKRLANLDLAINEYRDGVWGFEASVPIPTDSRASVVPCTRAFLTMETPGDLSSLGYQQHDMSGGQRGQQAENWGLVYYAAVNPSDVTTATGDQDKPAGNSGTDVNQPEFGVEFVGRDDKGRRIMGCGSRKMISTEVNLAETAHIPLPDSVSMQDAASITVAYGTAIYALRVKINVRRGQKILIHDGAHWQGQAAIAMALHYGLDVFTTVDNMKNKEAIGKNFPNLNEDRIALSQNLAFESQFLRATNGIGMDIVMTSHTNTRDKVWASLRLLKRGGQYLDLLQHGGQSASSLISSHHLKGKSLIGIDFTHVVTDAAHEDDRRAVLTLVEDGLKRGLIKPLQTKVFDALEAEKAFQAAGNGDFTHKVLLKFREEEGKSSVPVGPVQIPAVPRTYCDPTKAYVVVGGLGGFGLEFAQWLVQKGCLNLVLTDRNGVTTGYQRRRLSIWERDGINVLTSTETCCTLTSTQSLMKFVQTLGPVGGIFLVTKVNGESPLKELSPKLFEEAQRQKIQPVTHLDAMTRDPKFRPHVHMFVAFTSVIGALGKANCTSTAFANTYVDRVCKKRALDGLPARCVQWGTVADIVTLTDAWETEDKAVCATKAQKMTSCFKALDLLIPGANTVTSAYVAHDNSAADSGDVLRGTMLQLLVAKEFGLSDFLEYDPNATLADLGMDSIMGGQVKAIFDNVYQLPLSTKEIAKLTITDLAAIDEKAGK